MSEYTAGATILAGEWVLLATDGHVYPYKSGDPRRVPGMAIESVDRGELVELVEHPLPVFLWRWGDDEDATEFTWDGR